MSLPGHFRRFGGVLDRSAQQCMEEMLAYTQEKNIHVRLKPAKT